LPKVPFREKVKVPLVSEFFAKLMVVTAAVAELDPFSFSDEGEIVHLEVGGPPKHVRGTFPTNPPRGARVSVKTADLAMGIVCEVGVAEMVKSPTGAPRVRSTSAVSLTDELVWLVAFIENLPVVPVVSEGGTLTRIVNCPLAPGESVSDGGTLVRSPQLTVDPAVRVYVSFCVPWFVTVNAKTVLAPDGTWSVPEPATATPRSLVKCKSISCVTSC